MKGEYIIVGDTKAYKECLVCIAGSYENAEEVLSRMLENPNESDKRLMAGQTNFRIKFVEEEDCWWHSNCD